MSRPENHRRARPSDGIPEQIPPDSDGVTGRLRINLRQSRAADTLRAEMARAPYRTLGLALGLGVIAGGGLWKVLARSLVGVAARVMVATIVPPLLDLSPTRHPES